MKIILDTQIFLWYISANKKLRSKHLNLITDMNNDIFLSVASIWECSVKQQIGKLDIPEEAAKYLSEKRILHQMQSLPIDENSVKHLAKLPKTHKDPFDRIIICQTIENQMSLITVDRKVKQYKLAKLKLL